MTDFDLGYRAGAVGIIKTILLVVGLLLLAYWGNGKDENK